MTKKNEKLINFYEFLTLRRNRECRINRLSFKHSRVYLKSFYKFCEKFEKKKKKIKKSEDDLKKIKK